MLHRQVTELKSVLTELHSLQNDQVSPDGMFSLTVCQVTFYLFFSLQWLPKKLERIAQFQYFFILCLPLTPYNVDLSRDMGSITWHWGTIPPTQCLIFKIQHCSGGMGLLFSFTE